MMILWASCMNFLLILGSQNFYRSKKLLESLGMPYHKLMFVQKNGMLYYKDNKDKDKCDICGVRNLDKFTFNLIHKNDMTKIIMTSYMCLFNHIIIVKNIIVLISKT
jgi:hypothetical protein